MYGNIRKSWCRIPVVISDPCRNSPGILPRGGIPQSSTGSNRSDRRLPQFNFVSVWRRISYSSRRVRLGKLQPPGGVGGWGCGGLVCRSVWLVHIMPALTWIPTWLPILPLAGRCRPVLFQCFPQQTEHLTFTIRSPRSSALSWKVSGDGVKTWR